MQKDFSKSSFAEKVTRMAYHCAPVSNAVVPITKNYQLHDSQTRTFLRVLQILRIYGRAPISTKSYISNNRNCIYYEAFKSIPIIIYTVLLQIILALGSLSYLRENEALFIHRIIPARL